jgi:hypothetical protein
MALDRLIELAAVTESVPGTLQGSAYSAANAKFLVIDPQVSYEPSFFTRNFKRGSLTTIDGIPGTKPGTISFTVEMGGHEDATPNIPPWDILMKACGFASVTTSRIAASDSFTGGPLYHGETITATGSGASGTAVVMHDTYPDASGVATIYITTNAITMATSGDTTLTGGTSGAVVNIPAGGAIADLGQTWYPLSFETVTITHSGTTPAAGAILTQPETGAAGIVTAPAVTTYRPTTAAIFDEAYDIVVAGGTTITAAQVSAVTPTNIPTLSLSVNLDGTVHQLRGARGNVEFTGTVGEPMLMRFTFQGIAVDPSDQNLLSGVVYESKVPPVLLGIGLTVGHEADDSTDDFYAPCVASMSINMNNQVSPRTCVNDAGGIEVFTITGRDPSGSMDPEKTLEASFPWVQDFLDGDIWRADWTVGSVTDNKFKMSMPGLQTTAAPHGERNGQIVRNLAFRVTGGHQTDNATGNVLYGSNNELVLSYIVN